MKTVYLLASGGLSLSANRQAWAAQEAMEARIIAAVERLGRPVRRAHGLDLRQGHGFIDRLKLSLETLRGLPADAPVIVAQAAWQHSRHVWPGLSTHEGPILTIAQWSGQQAAVPTILHLNGCLTRAGMKHSTLWSETFEDNFFTEGLRRWLERGKLRHDGSHVREFTLKPKEAPADLGDAMRSGRDFARRLREEKMIVGVFDGSDAGAVPDALLRRAGIFREHLDRSALTAEAAGISHEEAGRVFDWYVRRRLSFHSGDGLETGLPEESIIASCRTYLAAVRLADRTGCAAVGLPHPPGNGLVEGTLNSADRPPVQHITTGEEILAGEALPSFPGGDECAALDGLVTYRLWRELGYPPENAAYELRWGRDYRDDSTDAYVWTLLGPGSAPPAHFGGWERATCGRDLTLQGVGRPGWIVWSRAYVEDESTFRYDAGIAEVLSLPMTETEDRWQQTFPRQPILHVVLQGISPEQMLGRHPSDRVQVVYGPDKDGARRGLFAKAAAMRELGLEVAICGNISGER